MEGEIPSSGEAGYGPASYGEDFADVYDDWYADVSDVAATVSTIAQLCRAGGDDRKVGDHEIDDCRVLELGVGTGRLALALAAKGIHIDGIDASTAMLAKLAAKDPNVSVNAFLGDIGAEDFAGLVPGPYRAVLAAYNTFFNLATAESQLRCLRSVAKRLEPDGRLLIEAFLPAAHPAGASGWPQVEERRVGDSLLLNVSVQDVDQQVVRGRNIEVNLGADSTGTGATAPVSVRSWMIRYLTPGQLDELAAQAGLMFTERWADWQRSPFDPDGTQHVSVYALDTQPTEPKH